MRFSPGKGHAAYHIRPGVGVTLHETQRKSATRIEAKIAKDAQAKARNLLKMRGLESMCFKRLFCPIFLWTGRFPVERGLSDKG